LIFKYKKDFNGNIIKRKSRLVAREFTQKFGIDFQDTFSPTLKSDSIRIFISISAKKNFNIEQINVNAAYLNAKSTEKNFMKPPQGHPDYNKKYWKLNKAIYGLKQSGREWNKELNKFFSSIGFKRLVSEPCIYIKEGKFKNIIYLLGVYVNDILISGIDSEIY